MKSIEFKNIVKNLSNIDNLTRKKLYNMSTMHQSDLTDYAVWIKERYE